MKLPIITLMGRVGKTYACPPEMIDERREAIEDVKFKIKRDNFFRICIISDTYAK